MNRWGRWCLTAVLSAGVLVPVSFYAQAPSAAPGAPQTDQNTDKKQDNKQDNKKDAKKPSQRQLYNELASPYKKWLSEDVIYIITDEERRAFVQLQTNEEREEFIEAFWQRRNPDPDSTDNPVKEEHYRRIAYANEHFASGIPGWKTDRGHVYIAYGKPDTIETHPTGGTWNRPMDQGGGTTSTYPYEDWTYNYIEGLGNNVELEFVDTTGTGQYQFTTDPSAKDALLEIPGAGLTLAEEEGLSTKAQRFMNTDGSHLAPSAMGGQPASLDEFNRLELSAKIFAPPVVKFKDLEAMVSSRIVRDQLHFTYRFDFMRITSDTVLVPITVNIPNSQMSFHDRDGVHSATLDLFARISTLSGRVVQTFEDTVRQDFPDSLLQQSLKSSSIYQKAVPLRPGLYRLDVVLKDTTSNNVGVLATRLAVPPFEDEKLAASTLILADQISPVAAKELGVGQFVIGSIKIRPKVDQVFPTNQPMGLFLQIYNLKVDEKTHKNDAWVDIQVFQGDKAVARVMQTSEEMKQTGEQLTVQQTVALATLPPGKYRVDIKATDALANQSITRTADFTVVAAEDKNATAQAKP
jgi:GWxTD domain-containing protein